MINVSRRGLIGMLAAGVGAAIVRPGIIMPIKPQISTRVNPDLAQLVIEYHDRVLKGMMETKEAMAANIMQERFSQVEWEGELLKGMGLLGVTLRA